MSDKTMKKVSKSFPERSRSRARRLARDQGGAVAVLFALMLAALIPITMPDFAATMTGEDLSTP